MASLTPRIDRFQKNYIINGDMRIAQRGTSFAAIADNAYSLDRWRYSKSGAMVHALTQDTDVPTVAQSGYLFQNSLRLNLTTPDTSIAAGDFLILNQKVEGYNWANLAQKPFTLSFWVKATLPGTYCVSLASGGGDRSYIVEYTINTANTWEKKVLNIIASPSTGTWNYSNGIGLDIRWVLASGTTYHTTANTWNTGNLLSTSNQVNGVNTGATDFRITGVMLSEGTLTDPEFTLFGKDFEAELRACQRYYEKSYDTTTTPGTATVLGFHYGGYTAVGSYGTICFPYRVVKRALPTHITRDGAGSAGFVSNFSAGSAAQTNGISISGVTIGQTTTSIYISNGSGIPVWFGAQFTAEAEL